MTGLPDFDIDRGTLLGAAAGAITAFGLGGRTSHEDNVALAKSCSTSTASSPFTATGSHRIHVFRVTRALATRMARLR
jgi:hypothetical protein